MNKAYKVIVVILLIAAIILVAITSIQSNRKKTEIENNNTNISEIVRNNEQNNNTENNGSTENTEDTNEHKPGDRDVVDGVSGYYSEHGIFIPDNIDEIQDTGISSEFELYKSMSDLYVEVNEEIEDTIGLDTNTYNEMEIKAINKYEQTIATVFTFKKLTRNNIDYDMELLVINGNFYSVDIFDEGITLKEISEYSFDKYYEIYGDEMYKLDDDNYRGGLSE